MINRSTGVQETQVRREEFFLFYLDDNNTMDRVERGSAGGAVGLGDKSMKEKETRT